MNGKTIRFFVFRFPIFRFKAIPLARLHDQSLPSSFFFFQKFLMETLVKEYFVKVVCLHYRILVIEILFG